MQTGDVSPWVAQLVDMCEFTEDEQLEADGDASNANGTMRIGLRWLYRPEDVLREDDTVDAHPRELFLTDNVCRAEVNSIDVVDGVAIVKPRLADISVNKRNEYFCSRFFLTSAVELMPPSNHKMDPDVVIRNLKAGELRNILRVPSCSPQLFWRMFKVAPHPRKSTNAIRGSTHDASPVSAPAAALAGVERVASREHPTGAKNKPQPEKQQKGRQLKQKPTEEDDMQRRAEKARIQKRDDGPLQTQDEPGRLQTESKGTGFAAVPAERQALLRVMSEKRLAACEAALEEMTQDQLVAFANHAPLLAESLNAVACQLGNQELSGWAFESHAGLASVDASRRFWDVYLSSTKTL
jgi:hypothetical protein